VSNKKTSQNNKSFSLIIILKIWTAQVTQAPPTEYNKETNFMKPNIILLLRTNNWLIKTLKDLLEAEGYNVIILEDSLALYFAVINKKLDIDIDVLITELMLTKMDGAELTKRLTAHPVSFPILITSFHTTEEQGKELEEQGAFRYIHYPIDYNQLLDTVLEATAYSLDVKY